MQLWPAEAYTISPAHWEEQRGRCKFWSRPAIWIRPKCYSEISMKKQSITQSRNLDCVRIVAQR